MAVIEGHHRPSTCPKSAAASSHPSRFQGNPACFLAGSSDHHRALERVLHSRQLLGGKRSCTCGPSQNRRNATSTQHLAHALPQKKALGADSYRHAMQGSPTPLFSRKTFKQKATVGRASVVSTHEFGLRQVVHVWAASLSESLRVP
jgi:hypothetical protein